MTSSFQDRVYANCVKIPKGKVTTYGLLAKSIAGHPRAVGGALRRNPHAPRVPCHRVVAADLTIGGFKGCKDVNSCNIKEKKRMLEAEGVQFEPNSLRIKQSCLYTFGNED